MTRARLYRWAATITIMLPTVCILCKIWALFWGDYPIGRSTWVSGSADG